jgi:hypothetical protein
VAVASTESHLTTAVVVAVVPHSTAAHLQVAVVGWVKLESWHLAGRLAEGCKAELVLALLQCGTMLVCLEASVFLVFVVVVAAVLLAAAEQVLAVAEAVEITREPPRLLAW